MHTVHTLYYTSYNLTHRPVLKSRYSGWRDPSIELYISISSFRDPLCPITLKNLFTKATYPERVFPGVIQQNAEDDEDCLETYCKLMLAYNTSWTTCPYKEQVRMTKVHAKDARGPTWARAKGN